MIEGQDGGSSGPFYLFSSIAMEDFISMAFREGRTKLVLIHHMLLKLLLRFEVVSSRDMASFCSVWSIGVSNLLPSLTPKPGKGCRWVVSAVLMNADGNSNKGIQSQTNINGIIMSTSLTSGNYEPQSNSKRVWVWTESRQVMTAAVERGWNTFMFSSSNRALASDWSSIALIYPLFLEDGEILDCENRKVATFSEIASPQQLQELHPVDEQAENVVINLLDWQVIPAENIVAAFQGSPKTVFAISKSPYEAQIFLEALEQGLGGIVFKVDDVGAVLELKDYFDRRNEVRNLLSLTKATVTRVQIAGMGDRVCVDLCSLMRPGEGVLVGSFARGLFLVHSECLESNYIASRPFRVNAGPVHAYVAVPGGKTCYLSELQAGKEVLVVDQNGMQRTAVVGRVKIETRPLILVEAKKDSDCETIYSILLQNAETVALVCPILGNESTKTAIPVTSLKVGDEVVLRTQGGARHTGIEIQEFILEK